VGLFVAHCFASFLLYNRVTGARVNTESRTR
jgi:hypothetical protein